LRDDILNRVVRAPLNADQEHLLAAPEEVDWKWNLV